MAKKFVDLPAGGTIDGTEIIADVQDDVSVQHTIAQVATFARTSRVGMAFEKELAMSDLTTDLVTGTEKAYFRPAFDASNVSYRLSLLVDSSSGLVTVDMNKNGSTMASSTKASIDATEKTSLTGTSPTMTTTTWTADDIITFDIDAAGTGAKGLIVTVTGKYA